MKMDDLKNLDLQELIENIQELDFENVGGWPMPIKVVSAVIVFGVVILLGFMFAVKPVNADFNRLQAKQKDLMSQYEKKAFKAKNLDQYREQLKEMKKSFGSLLQQLPKDTEVPGLLEDITHAGLNSGLEFEKIELGDEKEEQFYAKLPIKIVVKGDYHGFGSFVSAVAALPRIVTLHDFDIKPVEQAGPGDNPGVLEMSVTADTYRYASDKGGSGNKNGKGRKRGK